MMNKIKKTSCKISTYTILLYYVEIVDILHQHNVNIIIIIKMNNANNKRRKKKNKYTSTTVFLHTYDLAE